MRLTAVGNGDNERISQFRNRPQRGRHVGDRNRNAGQFEAGAQERRPYADHRRPVAPVEMTKPGSQLDDRESVLRDEVELLGARPFIAKQRH